jgi:glutathione S-transferase
LRNTPNERRGMKLYDSQGAPNPRRVRWFMAEKAIDDIEVVEIDLLKGEHKTKAYLDETGVALAPALVLDEGTVLTESIAICRYLESLHPEPNMFGRDPLEAAVIEMWTRRAEMTVANPLMLLARHTHPALAVLEDQVAEVALNNRQVAERGLVLLDRRLAGRAFIAAERLTMADIVVACSVDFARLARFRPPEALADFRRWHAAMSARPAAKAGVRA